MKIYTTISFANQERVGIYLFSRNSDLNAPCPLSHSLNYFHLQTLIVFLFQLNGVLLSAHVFTKSLQQIRRGAGFLVHLKLNLQCFVVLQPRNLMDFRVTGLARLSRGQVNRKLATWRIKLKDRNFLKDQATIFTMDSSSKILFFHKIILLE